MRILLIEDEHYAAKRLKALINEIIPSANILAVLDSVEDSKKWFNDNEEPDLVFMDIQLADGLSFKIFEEIQFKSPAIFVTAFDEYAIEAFKLNSIDYLLKPIDREKLKSAIEKFTDLHSEKIVYKMDWSALSKSLYAEKEEYRKRFLIKVGNAFQYLNSEDIAIVYSEDGVSFALNLEGKRLMLDNSIETISKGLDPKKFFQISRKHIVALASIDKIHPYLNSRLKLDLKVNSNQELVVARERVKQFKSWLDS